MPAPPFIAAATVYGGGSANLPVFIDCGTVLQLNRCVLLFATDAANAAITPVSATYDGVPMTAGTVFTSPGGKKYRLFWLIGVATSATNQAIVTWDGVTTQPDVYAFSYHDVLALSGETSASGTSTTPSWTVPSTPSTSTVVAVMARANGVSSAPSSPAVSRHSLLNNTNWLDDDIWDEVAGASSVTIDGTIESNTWFGIAFSLDSVVGGGGGGVTLANIERSVGRGSFRGQY